jgi:arabinogalactan oligomer/maltooligosaccharide transport system substrate-binding protein
MMSLRLTMTLCLSVALACGKSTPDPHTPAAPSTAPGPPAPAEPDAAAIDRVPTEVVLWHAYRGLEKEALGQAVDAWHEAQEEVRVRLQAVPYDPFVDKIGITVPRGQGPDLFIFAHNMIGSWVDKEILEPLGDHIEPARLRDFVTESVQALVYRQNLYGLPLALKSLVLFHNTALLPKVPDDMAALVTRLQEVMSDHKGVYGLAYEAGLLYFHAPWMHAFGGSVFGPDGAPSLDTSMTGRWPRCSMDPGSARRSVWVSHTT